MVQQTTIQVSRQTADIIRRLFPGFTYDQAIQILAVSSADEAKVTRILPFSVTANPLTRVEQTRNPGVDGKIISAHLHFPSGPSGLVDVRIMLNSSAGDTPVVPSIDDAFIALNDATLDVFDLNIKVGTADKIRVEWYNYDSGFSHTIPVEVIVERVVTTA